jgi:phosphoribosylanthranilate isomerase
MSRPWIKICGITTHTAVGAAVAARADALGFVFADSPRRVTPEEAFRLAAPTRGRLLCVAIVRQATQSLVDEILRVLRPDALQADIGELANLRLPSTLEILPVASTRDAVPDRLPDRLLLERPPVDDDAGWDEAGIRTLCRQTQLILAGGLDAGNVTQIVRSLHPFGLDVSRGVESRPGLKDPELIKRFVKAARSLKGVNAL